MDTSERGLESLICEEPTGQPCGPADDHPNRSIKVPKMTPGRAALIGLMDRYLHGLLDPFVTLLEVHKLVYFIQEAGEPLNLGFEKGRYGPYAGKLRHVLRPLEGHLISGYQDGGDAPGKQLKLVPGAVDDATAFLERHPKTRDRLTRVSDLVEGFESSFGLELLSTVHWVANERPSASEDEVIPDAYAWNPRKRQFSERQMKLALDLLKDKGLARWVAASHWWRMSAADWPPSGKPQLRHDDDGLRVLGPFLEEPNAL